LIEAIEDSTIAANEHSGKAFGITGNVNRNGNDGTITRFGWKAQNKSLVIFAGEAYNVEQGITNELFPDERGEGGVQDPVACRQVVPAPQDAVTTKPQPAIDDVNNFADFMRFLAAPVQVASYDSVTNDQITAGEAAFNKAGCNVCHMRSMTTGNHANAALRFQTVNLFSDLLLHDIGTGDGIAQGLATGAQFRTAPLWGVGQRLFFLHDGSKTDLVDVINAHGGEATRVINNFHGVSVGKDKSSNLTADEQQNLVYFLRSL
ncbi:MAG: thiol oxidoreductase, partial [Acidobacteria bacterium]